MNFLKCGRAEMHPWGKMVGERGLAVLAVGGNIVTSWSWFGVNELGVGLHSYGFMEGAFWWLIFFSLTQLGFMAMGLFPDRFWLWISGKRTSPPAIPPTSSEPPALPAK